MEPFGLFDFLKTLLSSPTQNDENSPSSFQDGNETNASSSSSFTPETTPPLSGDSAKNTPSYNEKTQKETAQSGEQGKALDGAQKAFLQFLEAHDERAKRIRRP
ncbi:MAG: hypothetical protein IKD47_01400 [Clostridia bacterium]|nr:hypothetical protein [Clostridia bacterium]